MTLLLLAALAVSAAELTSQAEKAVQEGRGVEAERLWKQALAADPRHFPALFDLGLYYFNQRNWKDASHVLGRAADVSPKDFNTRYLLGGALSRQEDTLGALRQWRAAIELKPEHRKLLQLMAVEYGKGRFFQEAATAARRAVELDPADRDAYFVAIKTAQDAGDTDSAFQLAKAAAERFPDSARANLEYGFHLGKQGKVEEAMTSLARAMKQDPGYEEPYFFYADLLVKQGKNREAIEPLLAAISIRPDYVPARVLLARARMNLEEWQAAMAELRAASDQDPKHPQPHLLMSQIYFRLGEEGLAQEEKKLSLRLRRENPTVLEAVQGRPFPER